MSGNKGSWILSGVRSAFLIAVAAVGDSYSEERAGRFTPAFREDTVRLKPIVWTLSLCLLFAIPSKAQAPAPRPGPPPARTDPLSGPVDADENQARIAHDLAKKANQERQASLKADTDKLLKLAVQLKDDVDKSNENVLSLDVLKKAEEIEKLAHSVKEKMKAN
ncbi:MAG: hypothetical protein WBE44_09505 [Terriglobales bacterium]